MASTIALGYGESGPEYKTYQAASPRFHVGRGDAPIAGLGLPPALAGRGPVRGVAPRVHALGAHLIESAIDPLTALSLGLKVDVDALDAEVAKWAKVITTAGVKAEQ